MKMPRLRILFESFLPVFSVLLILFFVLLYVQYKAAFDTARVTTIEIEDPALAQPGVEAAGEEDEASPLLSTAESPDPRYRRAAQLMAERKWDEAEKELGAILADGPSSHAQNDLGVLYFRKGELGRALKQLDRALKTRPAYPAAYFNRGLALSRSGRNAEAAKDYEAFIFRVSDHFDAHYNLGLALLKLREFQRAAEVFSRASRLAGGERKAKALYGLGSSYRESGPENESQARKAFEEAIRLRPDFLQPRYGLALLEPHTAEGRKRALAQYDVVLKLKPGHPSAYFNLGLLHSDFGDYRAAEEAYRNAIRLNPDFAKARYNLGLLLLASKRWTDARGEFEWVLQRDPENAENLFNLGRAAYGQKDFEGALRAYRRAAELRKGKYPEAYLNMGLVSAALKRYDEAEAFYRKAVGLNQTYPEAWYNIGLSHLRRQNWNDAEAAFREALKHRPHYEQAWFNLGVLYARSGRDSDAVDAYKKALEIRPNYHEARLNLAVRYAKQKRYEEAISEYRALLSWDDTYALAWINLGIAYRETGRPAEAEAALRRSLSLQPDHARAMMHLGLALAAQGKYDEAISTLRKATDAETDSAEFRLNLGRVLFRAGRIAEARVELDKALRLDPSDKDIKMELEALGKKQ